MGYRKQIQKPTETNGSPSKGTRKAANALEHVFNPPLQGHISLIIQVEEIYLPRISTDGFGGVSAMFALYLE
jgi:hypothetical protein